jgi:hypothetical protein
MANTTTSTPEQPNWAKKAVNTISDAFKWLYKVSLVANKVHMEKFDSPATIRHSPDSQAAGKSPKATMKTEPQSLPQSRDQTRQSSEESSLSGSATCLRLAEIEAEVMTHMDGVDFLLDGPRYDLARQEFVERYE